MTEPFLINPLVLGRKAKTSKKRRSSRKHRRGRARHNGIGGILAMVNPKKRRGHRRAKKASHKKIRRNARHVRRHKRVRHVRHARIVKIHKRRSHRRARRHSNPIRRMFNMKKLMGSEGAILPVNLAQIVGASVGFIAGKYVPSLVLPARFADAPWKRALAGLAVTAGIGMVPAKGETIRKAKSAAIVGSTVGALAELVEGYVLAPLLARTALPASGGLKAIMDESGVAAVIQEPAMGQGFGEGEESW